MPEPEPGPGVEAELIPAAPSSWRSVHVLVVSNRGAHPVEIGVRCSDDAGRLQFEHAPGLRLGLGQTAQLPITVRAAAPWTGPPVRLRFAVDVTTTEGGSLRLAGERTVVAWLPALLPARLQAPMPSRMPAWAPLVAGLAVAGVAIGATAFLSAGDDKVPAGEPLRAALTASPTLTTTQLPTTRAATTTHRTRARQTLRTTTTRLTSSSTTTTKRRTTTTTTAERAPFTSTNDVFIPGAAVEVPAKLIDVRVEHRRLYDRLILEFDGPVSDVNAGYIAELPLGEEGIHPSIGGDAYLNVVTEGVDVLVDYSQFFEVGMGLEALVNGGITEAFEGLLSFTVGVPHRLPFRAQVLNGSTHVVIDVAHPD